MMDFISILIEAKKLGIDFTQLIQFALMYWLVIRHITKIINAQFDKLIQALNSLEKAHNERLSKIEYHVGIKKGDL